MNKIILIGGGSASGKTYIVTHVLKKLNNENITYISMDDYYKDLSNLSDEERKKVNFDHPKSLDWKLMVQQLKDLKAGKSIDKPKYNFVIHNRVKETEKVEPNKIILVEGIMALVNADLRKISDMRVFISCIRERRFLRRLIRDHEERGRSYESIIEQYFATVQPMFEEIIQPSKNYADVVLENSGFENKAIDVLAKIIEEMANS